MSHTPDPENIDALQRRRRLGWTLFAIGVPGLVLLIDSVARLSFNTLDVIVIDEAVLDRVVIRLGVTALASLPALFGLWILQKATPLAGGRFGADLLKAAPWLTLAIAGGLALPFIVPLYQPMEVEATKADASRAWLRELSGVQEAFFKENFRYAGDPRELELSPPPQGMTVWIVAAGRSWSARIVGEGEGGCAARYGDAPGLSTPGGLTPGENQVVCDPF